MALFLSLCTLVFVTLNVLVSCGINTVSEARARNDPVMRFLCSPDFQHPFTNQLKVQKIICFLCYGFVPHCLPPAQPQPPAHTDRPTTAATSTTSTTTARTTTTTPSTTTSTGTTVEATE